MTSTAWVCVSRSPQSWAESRSPIGICGLIKRDTLADVDIGFAFLPQFWSMGYAYESAAAVMDFGSNALALERIVGETSSDNGGSIRVLEKLGVRFERIVRLSADEPEIRLYAPATRARSIDE